MSKRFPSLYSKKSNETSHDDRQGNRSVSSSSFINGTRVNSLYRHESHSKDNSFNSTFINTSHYNRSLSNNPSSIFKPQDADEVVGWIDNIKARYENLKSKQQQELNELLQRKQEEDNKRRLKLDMQQKHFDEDFEKLGKLLEEKEAAKALIERGSLSLPQNLLSFHNKRLPNWTHQRKDGNVDEDDDMEDSEVDNMDQDDIDQPHNMQFEKNSDVPVNEAYRKCTSQPDQDQVIEISSDSEPDEELEREAYEPSTHTSRFGHHNNNQNDSIYQIARNAVTYSQSANRRIDLYGNKFAYADKGQEGYSEKEYQQEGYYEIGGYNEEENYNNEQSCYQAEGHEESEKYEDEGYEEKHDHGYAYRDLEEENAFGTKPLDRDYLNSQAEEEKTHEFDSGGDNESYEEVESALEVESDYEGEEAQDRYESDEEEFRSTIQEDDYGQSPRTEIYQVDLLGESSMDSGIESVGFMEYVSTDASYPKHQSAPISIDKRSVSPHPSELENLVSNFDSQAEGFADEEKEEDDHDDHQNAPASTYNTLMAFASRALGDRSLHNFKETHTQSGYMADAEYTDNNLPKVLKDDDIDSDSYLSNNDFRPGELAPVPDPFYAQELSEQRMKVNDFDENRSEGSLADESQYESHRSDYQQDKDVHVQVDGNTNTQREKKVLKSQDEKVSELGKVSGAANTQVCKYNDKLQYLSDESPPAPIFKSIEEDDDPETVLQNLKEAEKKYNIKIDAVEDLERSIRSCSEPPDADPENKGISKTDINILDIVDALDDNANKWRKIPVPVLENIEANSSSNSTTFDSNSSRLELDDVKLDEVADDFAFKSEFESRSGGVIEGDAMEVENVETEPEHQAHDEFYEAALSIQEHTSSREEDQERSILPIEYDALINPFENNMDYEEREDKTGVEQAVVQDDENIVESSLANSDHGSTSATERPASENTEVEEIDTPMLDSLHESSFYTEYSGSAGVSDYYEEDHSRSSSVKGGTEKEEPGREDALEETFDRGEAERSELKNRDAVQLTEYEDVTITSNSPDTEEEEEEREMTVISTDSEKEEEGQQEEGVTIISTNSSCKEEDLTVIHINSRGHEGSDKDSDDLSSPSYCGRLASMEQTYTTNVKPETGYEEDSRQSELTLLTEPVPGRTDREGGIEIRTLQPESALAERDVDNELVQDVIDMAYRLAENEGYGDDLQDDSFGGLDRESGLHIENSGKKVPIGHIEESNTESSFEIKLTPSEIRKKLLYIFPNVGPTTLSILRTREALSQSRNRESANLSHGPKKFGSAKGSSGLEITEEKPTIDVLGLQDHQVLETTTASESQSSKRPDEVVKCSLKKVFHDENSGSSYVSEQGAYDAEKIDENVARETEEEDEEDRDMSEDKFVFGSTLNTGAGADNRADVTIATEILTHEDISDKEELNHEDVSEIEEDSGEPPESVHGEAVGGLLQAATKFFEEMEYGEPSVLQSDEGAVSGNEIISTLTNGASQFIEEMDEGKLNEDEGEINEDVTSDDGEAGISSPKSAQLDSVNDIADAASHFVEQMEGNSTEDASVSVDEKDGNATEGVSKTVKFAEFASLRLNSFSEIAKRLMETTVMNELSDELSDSNNDESIESVNVEITYTRPSTRRRRKKRVKRHNLLPDTASVPFPVKNPDAATLLVPSLDPVTKEEEVVNQVDTCDNSSTSDIEQNEGTSAEEKIKEKSQIDNGNSKFSNSELSKDISVSRDEGHEEAVSSTNDDPKVGSKIVSDQIPYELPAAPQSDEIQTTLENIAKLKTTEPSLEFREPSPVPIMRRNPSKRKARARRRRILGLDLSEIERFEPLNIEEHDNEFYEDESDSRGRKRVVLNESLPQSSITTMEYPASRTRSKSPLKKRRKIE